MSKTTSALALADPIWQEQARLLFERLPEHHRRWLAGLLSVLAGYGGDVFVAELLAVHEDTVPETASQSEGSKTRASGPFCLPRVGTRCATGRDGSALRATTVREC